MASDLPRIVLMVPLRRCGSHAIRLRLNLSEEFFAPYPLHVVDFLPLLPQYGDLKDDVNWKLLIEDVIGLQKALMVEWKGVNLDPVSMFDELEALPHTERSIHMIVGHLLRVSGRSDGDSVKVTLDKSCDGVHYAEEYLKCYPDLLFLNVVRDPRAQVASMNDAIIHEFSTLNNIEVWLKAYKEMDTLMEKYPDKVVTIRFEDFISDQAATLKKVCEFMGIDYSDDLCDIKKSVEGKQMSELSPLWTSNFSHPMKSVIDKYKKKLSYYDVEMIETLCGEYMDKYGYDKFTLAQSVVSDEDRAKAVEASQVNKEKAWDVLQNNCEFDKDFELRKIRSNFLQSCRDKLASRNAQGA